MNTCRIAIVTLTLLVVPTAAFADSEEKKKGATEPQPPTEQPKAEAPPPPAPPPAVSTTTTTAAYTEQPAAPAEKSFAAGDRLSLEPLIGYGTNDFNFGAGGRVGYTFPIPVYVGATFMWNAGERAEVSNGASIGHRTRSFYYPGAEVGYDIGVGYKDRVMIRPYGGVAALFKQERVSLNGSNVTDTNDEVMLYPGITIRYNIPSAPVFIGGDTRLLIPLENEGLSYQAFFVTGLSM